MNITKSDKKSIKNFITTYLSVQAVFGLAIIAIFIVFGSMHLKKVMNFRDNVKSHFKDSSEQG